MRDNTEAWPGSQAAAEATMTLFAVLGADDDTEGRSNQIVAAIEKLHSNCPGPREWHSALFSAVRVAGALLLTANDQAKPGQHCGLVFSTMDGQEQDADQVPPAIRFVARWITAAVNDDMDTCLDLFFGISVSEEESAAITDQLLSMLITFLETAVRSFLKAGKPLDPELLKGAQ